MPGVGIVVVKDGFLDSRSRLASEPQYLDLHTHLTTMRDLAQTPNTPANSAANTVVLIQSGTPCASVRLSVSRVPTTLISTTASQ